MGGPGRGGGRLLLGKEEGQLKRSFGINICTGTFTGTGTAPFPPPSVISALGARHQSCATTPFFEFGGYF